MVQQRRTLSSSLMIAVALAAIDFGTTSAFAGRFVSPYAGSYDWEEGTGETGWIEIDRNGDIIGQLDSYDGVLYVTGSISEDPLFNVPSFSLTFTPYITNKRLDKKNSTSKFGVAGFLGDSADILGYYYTPTGFPDGSFLWTRLN